AAMKLDALAQLERPCAPVLAGFPALGKIGFEARRVDGAGLVAHQAVEDQAEEIDIRPGAGKMRVQPVGVGPEGADAQSLLSISRRRRAERPSEQRRCKSAVNGCLEQFHCQNSLV